MEKEKNATTEKETTETTGKIQVTLGFNGFFFIFFLEFFCQFAVFKN